MKQHRLIFASVFAFYLVIISLNAVEAALPGCADADCDGALSAVAVPGCFTVGAPMFPYNCYYTSCDPSLPVINGDPIPGTNSRLENHPGCRTSRISNLLVDENDNNPNDVGWDVRIDAYDPNPSLTGSNVLQSYVEGKKVYNKFDPMKDAKINPYTGLRVTRVSGNSPGWIDVGATVLIEGVGEFKIATSNVANVEGESYKHMPFSKGNTIYVSLHSGNEANMNEIVKAINEKKKMQIKIINYNSGQYVIKDVPAPLTNCVHYYGSGENKIVFAKANDVSLSYGQIGAKIEELRTNGMEVVDPFAKYKDKFSYYIDLKTFKGGSGGMDTVPLKLISSTSSCLTDVPGKTDFVLFDNSVSQAYATPTIHALAVHPSDKWETILHEIGHSFAKLNDEYNLNQNFNAATFIRTNCRLWPTENIDTLNYGTPYRTCASNGLYRTSFNSIMNVQTVSSGWKFNVYSCSYIIKAIKGGNSDSYLKECASLGTNHA